MVDAEEDCDDSNVCTADTCDPSDGCKHINVFAACDDNDLCTVSDLCQAGSCQGGRPGVLKRREWLSVGPACGRVCVCVCVCGR